MISLRVLQFISSSVVTKHKPRMLPVQRGSVQLLVVLEASCQFMLTGSISKLMFATVVLC